MIKSTKILDSKNITKENVLKVQSLTPKRKCFSTYSGIQDKKKNSKKSFSISFIESIGPIFEAMTDLKLSYSNTFENYYLNIENEQELNKIKEWEERQGTRIFLRDTLSLSIALGLNLQENHTHTDIGKLENQAKHSQDLQAIKNLTTLIQDTISSLPFYKNADFICAIPPSPDKTFDLPSTLVSNISNNLNKLDITSNFRFHSSKSSIKESSLDQKWDVWESTGLYYDSATGPNLKGKTIILIDDKYQSGITIQFVAMKLQQAGASAIYGLSIVKTLRDTDNL
ncbi:MAG: hypothetical protein IPP74_12905 [Alphaproteobacteria bacterium]|nr:hypothetical protein [Alphaproteobacteria bacterium]